MYIVVAVARAVLFPLLCRFQALLLFQHALDTPVRLARGDCCVLRRRKSGRAEVAVDSHNWRPRVRVYTLTDPTHNPPNKFNYCDHIFATEGLLTKFAKIKTAQKFVVP